MNNTNTKKIRTVNVNERGQFVIPEDIRADFGIKGSTTLVIIEESDTLLLKRESDVLEALEDNFWKMLSLKAMKNAWEKEDEVWDKIAKSAKMS